jgi:hypothetical protein
MEVFFGSIVLEDFKYSFFFYLDIIATLSLINDISWFLNPLVGLVGQSPDYEGVNAVPGVMYTQSATSGKVAQLIKSIRLIRLIRIIKLYKYIIKSKQASEQAKLNKRQKNAVQPEDSANQA